MDFFLKELPVEVMVYGAVLLVVNIVGFALMGFDKQRARKEGQRVPEITLMLIAVFGGAISILFGMILFKHKTSKKKFVYGVPLCYLLNKLIHLMVLRAIL